MRNPFTVKTFLVLGGLVGATRALVANTRPAENATLSTTNSSNPVAFSPVTSNVISTSLPTNVYNRGHDIDPSITTSSSVNPETTNVLLPTNVHYRKRDAAPTITTSLPITSDTIRASTPTKVVQERDITTVVGGYTNAYVTYPGKTLTLPGAAAPTNGNVGIGDTGSNDVGNNDSGNGNTGDGNFGNDNHGNDNIGNGNTGNGNCGNNCTGNYNNANRAKGDNNVDLSGQFPIVGSNITVANGSASINGGQQVPVPVNGNVVFCELGIIKGIVGAPSQPLYNGQLDNNTNSVTFGTGKFTCPSNASGAYALDANANVLQPGQYPTVSPPPNILMSNAQCPPSSGIGPSSALTTAAAAPTNSGSGQGNPMHSGAARRNAPGWAPLVAIMAATTAAIMSGPRSLDVHKVVTGASRDPYDSKPPAQKSNSRK